MFQVFSSMRLSNHRYFMCAFAISMMLCVTVIVMLSAYFMSCVCSGVIVMSKIVCEKLSLWGVVLMFCFRKLCNLCILDVVLGRWMCIGLVMSLCIFTVSNALFMSRATVIVCAGS